MEEGKASVTAQRVAARRLGFDRVAADFGDPEADQRLQADVAAGTPPGRDGPMGRYLAARTVFFDRVVVSALERGIDQVVVAAAGYDGRAWRYARPGVAWYELDHPATQSDKRARVDRLGLNAEHVAFVAADFTTDDVAGALAQAGVRPERPALVTCEGVAVYLDLPVLESLLSQLRGAVGPRSRLAISLSVNGGGAEEAARREAFQAGVAALGEPTRSHLTAEAADSLLQRAGWSVPTDLEEEGSGRGRRAGLVVAVAA
jgi:methyltransferase (TIGR00027 family)